MNDDGKRTWTIRSTEDMMRNVCEKAGMPWPPDPDADPPDHDTDPVDPQSIIAPPLGVRAQNLLRCPAAYVPDGLVDARLEDIVIPEPEPDDVTNTMPEANEAVKQWCRDKMWRTEWLGLFGNVGSGKSKHATAVASHIIDKEGLGRGDVIFVPLRPYLANCRLYDHKKHSRLAPHGIADIAKASVVIADDLGAEACMPENRGHIHEIVDYCDSYRKVLIVTSNADPAALTGTGADTAWLDERTLSRLKRSMHVVLMAGPDRRKDTARVFNAEKKG